jgi:hypothetical protein
LKADAIQFGTEGGPDIQYFTGPANCGASFGRRMKNREVQGFLSAHIVLRFAESLFRGLRHHFNASSRFRSAASPRS